MHSRAAHLIASLALAPHPEGGHWRELYRSCSLVQPADHRSQRSALTTIYFLLAAGEVSRWHRVASDEVWHYYEGDPLDLITLDPDFRQLSRDVLGPVGEGVQPVHTVPANSWQAACCAGAYTLVGCTVGPGFEFADFRLLRELPAEIAAVGQRYPELLKFA